MSQITLDSNLRARVHAAIENIEHFETMERFALRRLANAPVGTVVDAVYVDIAEEAFARGHAGGQRRHELAHRA